MFEEPGDDAVAFSGYIWDPCVALRSLLALPVRIVAEFAWVKMVAMGAPREWWRVKYFVFVCEGERANFNNETKIAAFSVQSLT